MLQGMEPSVYTGESLLAWTPVKKWRAPRLPWFAPSKHNFEIHETHRWLHGISDPTHRRSSVHRRPIFSVTSEIKGRRPRETIIVTMVEPGSNNVARDVRCEEYSITVWLCPIREEAKCVHFFDRLFLGNLLIQASCDEPIVGVPGHWMVVNTR